MGGMPSKDSDSGGAYISTTIDPRFNFNKLKVLTIGADEGFSMALKEWAIMGERQ